MAKLSSRVAITCIALTALSFAVSALPQLTVTTGDVRVWKAATTTWTSLKDSMTLAAGDSVVLATSATAKFQAADSILFLLKDSCVMSIDPAGPITAINLANGQLFLNRESRGETPLIRITIKGYTYVPTGTAAAFKITRQGTPGVAVLKGLISMSAPDGQTVDIPAGSYHTVDQTSTTLGEAKPLPQSAIKVLEDWSGVWFEALPAATAAIPPQPAITPEVTPAPAPAPEASTPIAQQEPEMQPVSPVATAVPSETAPQQPTPAASSEAPVQKASATPQNATTDTTQTNKQTATKEETNGKEKAAKGKPAWEVSASNVTVGDEQWTRIALAVDVPVWRFGVCFDVELFIDAQGQFSDKGWDFSKDGWAQSLARKIRYIRFNQETDPLFVKVGGLSSVTLGYGLVVDRFTNMLHYPDQKLIGMQFYLNDISPIGLTLQTMVSDFLDIRNDGGVYAARLGVRPLKSKEMPIISGIQIAGLLATDINQYAPAREWDFSLLGDRRDRDEDGVTDSSYFFGIHGNKPYYSALRQTQIDSGDFDMVIEHRDAWAGRRYDALTIVGGDISVPVISTKPISVVVYGQGGLLVDDNDASETEGWGIGIPGVRCALGPVALQVEYRRTEDYFSSSYFSPYYQDERLMRSPTISTKEQRLIDMDLQGVFGTIGFDIFGFASLGGSYQRLMGETPSDNASLKPLDQRFEATAGIGAKVLDVIPKINKVEAFFSKTNMQRTVMNPVRTPGESIHYDAFFEKSPNTYWGYRLGGEIIKGASIIWETRYGWEFNEQGELVDNNTVTIAAGLSF